MKWAEEKETESMAFTREFIRRAAKESGVEIPKELEDALVNEHLAARDAFSEGKVKEALEQNKADPAPKIKDTDEYKALKKEFDDYKAEIGKKAIKAAKEKAVRAYYESKGITGKSLDIAIRGSSEEINALEMDGDKIKDASALDELVKGTFSGLVSTTTVRGADTATPPGNTGGSMTKADIYKKDDHGRYVMSAAERQKALMENQIT